MIKKRRDLLLNIKSRITGWRWTDRIPILILLLVSAAIPVVAASPLKNAVPAAPNPAVQPVAALIENPLFGLPEPVGLSLIIFAGMLLAWAGLNMAWSKPQPQNAGADEAKAQPASNLTSSPWQPFVPEKSIREPKVPQYDDAYQNANTLLARFCKQ